VISHDCHSPGTKSGRTEAAAGEVAVLTGTETRMETVRCRAVCRYFR
jgi:hypothetical protein